MEFKHNSRKSKLVYERWYLRFNNNNNSRLIILQIHVDNLTRPSHPREEIVFVPAIRYGTVSLNSSHSVSQKLQHLELNGLSDKWIFMINLHNIP